MDVRWVMRWGAPLVALITWINMLPTSSARAQQGERTVSVVGGVSQFDLSGTGTTGVIGVRGDLAARRWLLLEGGLTVFRPNEQFDQRRTYVIPEVQVQAQVPHHRVRPYLGLGVGSLLASRDLSPQRALSGALGTRVLLRDARVNLRAELRVRGIGEGFSGAVAEWTLGTGFRF